MKYRSSKVTEPVDLSNWSTTSVNSIQQKDGHSCGVFVMMVRVSELKCIVVKFVSLLICPAFVYA